MNQTTLMLLNQYLILTCDTYIVLQRLKANGHVGPLRVISLGYVTLLYINTYIIVHTYIYYYCTHISIHVFIYSGEPTDLKLIAETLERVSQ